GDDRVDQAETPGAEVEAQLVPAAPRLELAPPGLVQRGDGGGVPAKEDARRGQAGATGQPGQPVPVHLAADPIRVVELERHAGIGLLEDAVAVRMREEGEVGPAEMAVDQLADVAVDPEGAVDPQRVRGLEEMVREELPTARFAAGVGALRRQADDLPDFRP